MNYVKPWPLFRDLALKGRGGGGRRLLGLDVGDKYMGLALSDSSNKIASPLSVLVRKKTNMDLMASDFQSLVSELSLAGLVVGCPLDRQRNTSESVSVKLFIDELGKTGKVEGLKYTFWDECFTSKNVEYMVRPLQLHPVHEKSIVDKFAAVGILQGYLDYVNKKLKVEIPEKSV